MLIVALALAVVALAALVLAVVTSNEVIAWVCVAASGLGVALLIVDAVRDRARRRSAPPPAPVTEAAGVDAESGEFPTESDIAIEDHPEEIVRDEPEHDMVGDDEPEYPEPAEEAAVHIVSEDELAAPAAAEAAPTAAEAAYTHVVAPHDHIAAYTYVPATEESEATDERRDR